MMHGGMPEYKLAEKMKSRFSGRGAAVSGMQASTTSELMKLAQMGGDPSENCSELDFRGGANRLRYADRNRPAYAPAGGTAGPRSRTAPVTGTPARGGAGMEHRNARPAAAASRGASGAVRPMNGAKNARPASGSGNLSGSGNTSGRGRNMNGKAKAKTAKTTAPKPKRVRPQPVYDTGEIAEVRVEGRRMTPMFAVFLVIGTMMIMSIVLSFSEIYQTTSEIAQLENTLAALRDQAAELELELEEKNDIRVIEQIATEQLGMVKEDAVQRKYISLSNGEHIDIIEDESAEEEPAASGILLSSIWSSLGNLFDYFR